MKLSKFVGSLALAGMLWGCGAQDNQNSSQDDAQAGSDEDKKAFDLLAEEEIAKRVAVWNRCQAEYIVLNGTHTATQAKIDVIDDKLDNDWYDVCDAVPNSQAKAACHAARTGTQAAVETTDLTSGAGYFHAIDIKVRLNEAINRADAIGLGINPNINVGAGDRLRFALDTIMAEHISGLMNGEYASAMSAATAALGLIAANAILAPVAVVTMTEFEAIVGAEVAEAAVFGNCVTNSHKQIAAAAVFNGFGKFNPPGLNLTSSGWTAGSGDTAALETHPTFATQIKDVLLDTSARKEEGGKVYRYFELGWEMPAAAVTTEDLVSPYIPGLVLVPAGSPLVVNHLISDAPPEVTYSATLQEIIVLGAGLTLHFLEDGAMQPLICLDPVTGPELRPGESDSCDLTQDVTGSPAQIAAGERHEHKFTLYAIGGNPGGNGNQPGGDDYFKYEFTLSSPYEAPNDPCYVWNSSTMAYEEDTSIPGCGPGGPGM